jgi:hypothetical protein
LSEAASAAGRRAAASYLQELLQRPGACRRLRVEFHPGRLPAGVWWASWDGVDGDIIKQEAVGLDRQHSAHRYLRFIEKTVAGFYWRW